MIGFRILKGLFIGIFRILGGIGRVFQKAAQVIRPRGPIEWALLLIAVPVPFGVTALFLYKYFKQK